MAARTLYHREGCPRCEQIRLALGVSRTRYKSRRIDDKGLAEVERASGQTSLPVLIEDDGQVVHDRALLQHLATRDRTILPESRRDQALTWVLVDRADVRLAPLVERLRSREGKPDPAERELLQEQLAVELALLDGMLSRGPYLFGNRPTLADLATNAYLWRVPYDERRSVLATTVHVAFWFERVRDFAYPEQHGTTDH